MAINIINLMLLTQAYHLMQANMFAEFIMAITIIEGTRHTLTINCSIIIDQITIFYILQLYN